MTDGKKNPMELQKDITLRYSSEQKPSVADLIKMLGEVPPYFKIDSISVYHSQNPDEGSTLSVFTTQTITTAT